MTAETLGNKSTGFLNWINRTIDDVQDALGFGDDENIYTVQDIPSWGIPPVSPGEWQGPLPNDPEIPVPDWALTKPADDVMPDPGFYSEGYGDGGWEKDDTPLPGWSESTEDRPSPNIPFQIPPSQAGGSTDWAKLGLYALGAFAVLKMLK